ncbi:CDP-diacylglycerol--glycerol-3-phosphate 3-phosphatidyltransferase [Parelusimicrobium proximum]|uniref:CDP-diacylglycerol--glycerol-3-phosphate 3-phosphatidyltransferase n=1 Tax=Parelusimicrobium proximum TaxID=3228953 RepID=UPI003D176B35
MSKTQKQEENKPVAAPASKLEMTLANKITLSRAGLSIIVFAGILIPDYYAVLVSTIVFVVAASSDWVDGKIARQTGTCTPFGAIVDPFVDKILVCSALFAFTAVPSLNVPVWAVFLIILRELTVSTLRVIAALDGSVLAAERWGKFKTVIQLVAVGVIFLVLNLQYLSGIATGGFNKNLIYTVITLKHIPYAITVIAALVTWGSMFSYLNKNWGMLEKSWSLPRRRAGDPK